MINCSSKVPRRMNKNTLFASLCLKRQMLASRLKFFENWTPLLVPCSLLVSCGALNELSLGIFTIPPPTFAETHTLRSHMSPSW